MHIRSLSTTTHDPAPIVAGDGKSPDHEATKTGYNQRLLQLQQLPRRSQSSSSDSILIPDRAGVTSAPAWPCLGFSMCPMVSIVPAKGHQHPARLGNRGKRKGSSNEGGEGGCFASPS